MAEPRSSGERNELQNLGIEDEELRHRVRELESRERELRSMLTEAHAALLERDREIMRLTETLSALQSGRAWQVVMRYRRVRQRLRKQVGARDG